MKKAPLHLGAAFSQRSDYFRVRSCVPPAQQRDRGLELSASAVEGIDRGGSLC
ncbi:MAG TPA: hypothetical protein VF871_02430 [Burkholderiales bacterium]